MSVDAMGHAANDGVLVGLLRQHWKRFRDKDTFNIRGNRIGQRPTVVTARVWFRIERVKVGRPAGHPNLNDRFGSRLFRCGWRRLNRGRGAERAKRRKPHRTKPPSENLASVWRESSCWIMHGIVTLENG